MKKIYLILILVATLALYAYPVEAQLKTSDVTLNITPLFPTPNQTVSANLESFAIDLDKTNIAWLLNSQEKISGVGKKAFSFNVGGTGVSLSIEARISTVTGQNIIKRAVITPADIDMMWEAFDSYAPPFYRGKTMVSTEGSFKVVAMPNLINSFGKVNPASLSYSWVKDETPQPDLSGWGKNYFVFKNSSLDNENTISVAVSDAFGGANTQGEITLQTGTPEIIFYENNPLLGVNYDNAVRDGFLINKTGSTLVAAPYFFSPNDLSSKDLSFTWSLNGEGIATPVPKNILSIKPAEGQGGSAVIKIAINNAQTLFQSLEKELNVSF